MRYLIAICIYYLSSDLTAQSTLLQLPSSPSSIVVDSRDNVIAHLYMGRVVKITPEGKMSYITDDIRKDIVRSPYPKCNAMAIGPDDSIYMADENLIWKLNTDGKVVLFAGIPFTNTAKDGPLKTAQFRNIEFIEVDRANNIYLGERDDTNKHNLGDFYLIRKISNHGVVSTLINTRESAELKTKWIAGMGVDQDGNIYLSDGSSRCIRKLDRNGKVSVMAGLCGKREFHPVYIQGDVGKAELMSPTDILINQSGDIIFSDSRLHRIIKVADKKVATMAGNSVIQPNNVNMGGRAKEGCKDGPALTALFNFPLGCNMAMDSRQNIYVIDGGNDRIRKLTPEGIVSTLAKK